MKVRLYFSPSKEGSAQQKEWDGKECKLLVKTGLSCNCLLAHVDNVTPDSVTVSFTGLEPDILQEGVESIVLMLEGREYQLAGFEPAEADSMTGSFDCILPDEINDQPWNIGYDLGTSIDVITNMVKNKAVEVSSKTENQEDAWTADIQAKLYSSSSSLTELFSTSLTGHLTLSSLDLDGSFQYLKSVKCSETSSSIVMIAKYIESTYKGNHEFRLTDQAKKLLQEPSKFRDRFGDYYVSDIRKGGCLIIIYNCEASSAEEIQRFNAKLSMDSEKLASFMMGSEFKKLVKEYNVRLKTQIFCHGCDELPYFSLQEDAQAVLKWLNRHKKPIPCFVKLKHYSSLVDDGVLSPTIDCPYETLQEIKSVYNHFWRLYADFQNVHKNYKKEKEEKFRIIYDAVTMRLPEIAGNKAYRLSLLRDIDELQKYVELTLLKYKKYLAIKALKKLEPRAGEGDKQKTDRKTQIE